MKHEKNRPDLPTEVRRLPCKPPVIGLKALDDALFEANKLYNALIAARRRHREAFGKLLRHLEPRITPLDTEIEDLYEKRREPVKKAGKLRINAQTRRVSDPKLVAQIQDLDGKIRAAKKNREALVEAVKESNTEALDTFWEEAGKELGQLCRPAPLPSLTRGTIYTEARISKRLKWRRLAEGQSKILYRIKNGKPFTWGAICNGDWPVVKLEEPQHNYKQGQSAHQVKWLSLNLGTARQPQWVTLPTNLYRPIPADAIVSRLVLLRIRKKYEVQVTVEHATAFQRTAEGSKVVCLDLNYRREGDTLNVATWVGSDGRWAHVRFPADYLQHWRRVEAIQSHRDHAFNTFRDSILAWKKQGLLSLEQKKALVNCHKWRSPERLIKLVREWANKRTTGDEERFQEADIWRHDELHLRNYQEGLRSRLLRVRTQWQQNLAAWLRRQGYGIVLLDGIRLKKLGTKPPLELADETLDQIRQHKNWACHHKLQRALRRSGMTAIKSKCAYSSRRCTACGHRMKASSDVTLTCPKCGHAEHRDVRGALNPLQDYLGHKVVLTQQGPDHLLDCRGSRPNHQKRRDSYERRHPQQRIQRLAHEVRRAECHARRDAAEAARTNSKPPRKERPAA